ncbi:MAG: DUF58 domain-containing protein [Clostridia bacterium]|nr:DUF58 domain-containing protein [Clostridia bacterium]
MLYLSVLLAAVILYILQIYLYRHLTTRGLTYHIRLDRDEVRSGEDMYLYEELSNRKWLPLPFIKVNTDLPVGMMFHFTDKCADGKPKETYEFGAQSIYVLRSYQKISRRWRVTGRKRGVYEIGASHLVTNDLFGMNPVSVASTELEDFRPTKLTVLPKLYDLRREFVAADGAGGDQPVERSRMTDPLLFAGARDYRSGDPMRAVNWKSSAVHGHYMVNIEEPTVPSGYNIILNTQSRTIEKDPVRPSAPEEVERCISTAATLLEDGVHAGLGIRMFWNTRMPGMTVVRPDHDAISGPVSDDREGHRITAVRTCRTPEDLIGAERLLAAIPEEISLAEEDFLDHILENPELYTASEQYPGQVSLILVSAYFSGRMLTFHRAMEARGVHIVYYIMTTYNNVLIPEDIEVYYLNGLLPDEMPKGGQNT